MSRKIFLTSLILIGILLLAGCCPEEKCKNLYPAVCKDPYQPTPGPIIDLEPKPANPSKLDWRADGVVQPPTGVSVFDPSVNCKLRDDFIGKNALEYKFFMQDGSEMGSPKKWKLENSDGTLRLEVTKDDYDRLYWTLIKKVGMTVHVCALTPTPKTANVVPVDFGEFEAASLKEISSSTGTLGKDIEIQVDVLNP